MTVLDVHDDFLTVAEGTASVTAPVAALAGLVPYAELRLGLQGFGPDLVSRLEACVRELAGREKRVVSKITGLYDDRLGQVADWCTDLGIDHEEQTQYRGRIRRVVLDRLRPVEGEYNRTLYLEIVGSSRLRFHESYQRGDDPATLRTAEAPLAEAEDRVVATFRELVAGGELGIHLPFRESRDRVYRRHAEARRLGSIRWHQFDRSGDLSLAVTTTTLDDAPTIEFRQMLFVRGAEPETSAVRTPLGSMGELITFLERRLDRPEGPHTEDELFACFAELTGRGDLGAAAGRESAEKVARLFAEAGVPWESSGKRKHTLLSTYREATGCDFSLHLTVEIHRRPGAAVAVGLLFTEYYDYTARPGDSGREYGYSATLEPLPADELVDGLGRRLGRMPTSGEPDERVVACFQAMLDSGDLSAALPLKENRDRVAAVLRSVGTVTTDSSVWVNS
ncbi:hypothetical protein AB0C29_17485 [Actinoplanes sp. NPDC048791]|uniref:hypothetical protein n=1 Tax=Actinoplanes sp. NPDC048791 TaxID=3154623 RepID=UPI0033F009CD